MPMRISALPWRQAVWPLICSGVARWAKCLLGRTITSKVNLSSSSARTSIPSVQRRLRFEWTLDQTRAEPMLMFDLILRLMVNRDGLLPGSSLKHQGVDRLQSGDWFLAPPHPPTDGRATCTVAHGVE